MTANINPETGIAYGIISANSLHGDVVDSLQMDGTEPYYDEAWEEHIAEMRQNFDDALADKRRQLEELGGAIHAEDWDEFDEEDYRDLFNESWQPDEPVHEGEMDGVKYRTTWLGGALLVFIFHSPHITHTARQCSPCVPNAGDLDSMDGDYTCYDVPPDWRDTE